MDSHRHIGNPTYPASSFPARFTSPYPYPVHSALPPRSPSHSIHLVKPYPAHSTHSVSSAYDLPSSSNTQSVRQFSNTRTTRMARSLGGPLIRHFASPIESLKQLVRGWRAGKKGQTTTIEMLPEDTLLEIFDFYRLDAMESSFRRPWKWHHLAHVCRKWRHILSMSPRRLELQVLCEYDGPIESILGSWPTLPLVVRHYGPKSKSLPNNVIVALRRLHRVSEIDLMLPSSLIGSIVEAIQEPLPRLECIRVTVENATGPPMPVREAFLGGFAPQLREIKLDGVAFSFPAIRKVLFSTNNLVELHLSNIPNDFYIPPDDLVAGLSTSIQLKRLTVGFHSPASRPPSYMTRPFQRTALPSLTYFSYHGACEYLEEFVYRIDLPTLGTIIIWHFSDIFFDIPQFCQFIPRLNALTPPTSVTIRPHKEYVVIFLSYTWETTGGCAFTISCKRLDWQLSFAAQILSQLSPFLSSVHDLTFNMGYELPTGGEDVDSTQWLELFQPFTHVTDVYVKDEQLVPSIARALVAEDMTTEILPELTFLMLFQYQTLLSSLNDAEQFVATRKLSGHTVRLEEA